MEKINKIVEEILGKIRYKTDEAPRDIQKFWDLLLSDSYQGHTRIVQANKEKLVIHVDSPARLFELSSKKQSFLKLLQKDFPEVKEIYFKIGKTQ